MISIVNFDSYGFENQQNTIKFLERSGINFVATSFIENNFIRFTIKYDILSIRQMTNLKNYIVRSEMQNFKMI